MLHYVYGNMHWLCKRVLFHVVYLSDILKSIIIPLSVVHEYLWIRVTSPLDTMLVSNVMLCHRYPWVHCWRGWSQSVNRVIYSGVTLFVTPAPPAIDSWVPMTQQYSRCLEWWLPLYDIFPYFLIFTRPGRGKHNIYHTFWQLGDRNVTIWEDGMCTYIVIGFAWQYSH